MLDWIQNSSISGTLIHPITLIFLACMLPALWSLETLWHLWSIGWKRHSRWSQAKSIRQTFSELGQFPQLSHLKLVKHQQAKRELEFLDSATENCKQLKTLDFYFYRDREDADFQHNYRVEQINFSKCNPQPSLKKLDITLRNRLDSSMLQYIMHKFTQLEHLRLEINITRCLYIDLTPPIVSQFCNT